MMTIPFLIIKTLQ